MGRPSQTTLRLNHPSDAYEQEADRVAQRTMAITPVNEQTLHSNDAGHARRRIYTRARAQQMAEMYERQFAQLGGQESLTRAQLWRVVAEFL